MTHGIIGLQDVMLRGRDPTWWSVGLLAGLVVVFAAFALWRFRREFRRG